jgi:hypothetical protein
LRPRERFMRRQLPVLRRYRVRYRVLPMCAGLHRVPQPPLLRPADEPQELWGLRHPLPGRPGLRRGNVQGGVQDRRGLLDGGLLQIWCPVQGVRAIAIHQPVDQANQRGTVRACPCYLLEGWNVQQVWEMHRHQAARPGDTLRSCAGQSEAGLLVLRPPRPPVRQPIVHRRTAARDVVCGLLLGARQLRGAGCQASLMVAVCRGIRLIGSTGRLICHDRLVSGPARRAASIQPELGAAFGVTRPRGLIWWPLLA